MLLLALSCATAPTPYASAKAIADRSEAIGGPKALGGAGDYLLQNERIRVVISGGHPSMGPGLYGGSLVDADLQRNEAQHGPGNGNDRFSEMFPTVNMNVPYAVEPGAVTIVSDGADGGAAVVRATATSVAFLSLLQGLWTLVNAPTIQMSTDYVIEPGKSWITLRTTAWVGDAAIPATSEALPGADELALLDLAIEDGFSFGDFYLQGGDIDVFAPGIGFDEDTAVYEAGLAGQNTFKQPFALDFVAGTGDGVSYGVATRGKSFVPLFTSSQTAVFGGGVEGDPDLDDRFPANQAYTYERAFFVGKGDVASVLDGILEWKDIPRGQLEGFVVEEGSGAPLSGVDVFVYIPGQEAPFSQFRTDVGWEDASPDGGFAGSLPVGDWELAVHEQGRGTGPRVPVTIQNGGRSGVTLVAQRAGSVTLRVVDEEGLLVPSKLTIMPADGQPVARDPVLGDGYIAGDPEAVVFNPYGETTVELEPGRYVAWATRGMEYELGMAEFEVSLTRPAEAQLMVVRSVDTSGWISADFHVHAQPSHDSGVTPADRVITMVSENVELLVSSDHDFIVDFRPWIEDLQLEPWIAAAVGVEVTTVELGHFLSFPLEMEEIQLNGGAFDWTGMEPGDIIEALEASGEDGGDPVTFVAHPRDGILGYFDQYGFNPYGGSPGDPSVVPSATALTNQLLFPDKFTLDFDALEVLNGKRFELIRTPLQAEIDAYAADSTSGDGYSFMERTLEEQGRLEGEETFAYGVEGQIDDWFTLLNLGYPMAALGNSDTHGKTSIEAGCPRTYVVSSTDDAGWIDPREIADNVAAGHTFTTSGPFVRFSADSGAAIVGDTYVKQGEIVFDIEVQSPTWMDVNRVEIYKNGTLVHEIEIPTPNADPVDLVTTWSDTPDKDSWYVMVAMGDDDLFPLFTPVEYPPIQLQDVVIEALADVSAVSSLLSPVPAQPRSFPTYPYAVTSPIYVDLDGHGWQAPGLPSWLKEPPEPEE